MADETGIDRLEHEQPAKLDTLPAVKIRFLHQLFEQKAITKSHNGIDINFPLVRKTLDTLDINPFSYDVYMQRVTQLPEVIPPADFDWDAEARKSVRESIRILYESGIVDRRLLVDASKFAGPGNTVIKNLNGHVAELATPPGLLPIPESKTERNKLISLSLDKQGILFTARHILQLTRNENLPMTEAKAIQLALISTSAHEYGHAVFLALAARGTTYTDSSLLWIDKIRKNDTYVHEEHFARGIEDIVSDTALTNLTGYTNEDANKVISKIEKARQQHSSLIADLVRSAGYNGFTWEEIKDIDKSIRKKLTENMQEDQNTSYQLDDLVAYNLPPYSVEELTQICKRGNLH